MQTLFEQKLRKVPGSDLLQDATLEEKAQFADYLALVTPEDVGKIVTILYERCKASISKLSATDIYVNLDEVDIETFRCIQSYAKSLVQQPSIEMPVTPVTPVLASSANLTSPNQLLNNNISVSPSGITNNNISPNITPEKPQPQIQQQVSESSDIPKENELNNTSMEIETKSPVTSQPIINENESNKINTETVANPPTIEEEEEKVKEEKIEEENKKIEENEESLQPQQQQQEEEIVENKEEIENKENIENNKESDINNNNIETTTTTTTEIGRAHV